MDNDIFISYSRRDQEFVTRLASDLDQQVAGAWFDQSDIQVGQQWHDEIMDGIRECKAFILVLSPDAAESRYVREELNKALELGKPIIPILYRPAKWSGEFETLVKEIQTLDLRSGSYAENFQKLVDGLVALGVAKIAGYEKPFMRQPVKVSLSAVLRKVPGWAFAWGIGWAVFWLIVIFFLIFLLITQDNLGSEDPLNFLVILLSGGLGGFIGGLLAGLFTMLSLRPNAPSITWKHMSPTIRVWGISGPLGMIVSGIVTAIMVAVGVDQHGQRRAELRGSQFRSMPGLHFRERYWAIYSARYRCFACFSAPFGDHLVLDWHVRRLAGGATHPQAGTGHHRATGLGRFRGMGMWCDRRCNRCFAFHWHHFQRPGTVGSV